MATIRVRMLVNDENGSETERLDGIEFGDRLDANPFLALEGPWEWEDDEAPHMAGEPVDFFRGKLTVAGQVFRYTGRSKYVGNMLWDQVEMPAGEAARLLNFLRTRPGWSREEGTTALFDKWESGGEFTADDLTTIPAETEDRP
jgi:hypothetical protein